MRAGHQLSCRQNSVRRSVGAKEKRCVLCKQLVFMRIASDHRQSCIGRKNSLRGNSFVRIFAENRSLRNVVRKSCHSESSLPSFLQWYWTVTFSDVAGGLTSWPRVHSLAWELSIRQWRRIGWKSSLRKLQEVIKMDNLDLLLNVHSNLEPPKPDGSTYLMRGNYHYYHYGCDGFQDVVSFVDWVNYDWNRLRLKTNTFLIMEIYK